LVGRRRVLDSTPLYDAVATMDTVTLVRSAIRGLLTVADPGLEDELRAVLVREDDYRAAGKPVCDYDDTVAREALVDALARDARALLAVLHDRKLPATVTQAAELLATVVGQDLEEGTDAVLRIARRVAKDRVISTVDPQSRHGHKTAARRFDGYQGHVGIDPDSEIITATTVTPGNAGDASVVADLIADLIAQAHPADTEQPGTEQPTQPQTEQPQTEQTEQPQTEQTEQPQTEQTEQPQTEQTEQTEQPQTEQVGQPQAEQSGGEQSYQAFGDCSYGSGEFPSVLEKHGIESGCKTQPPAPRTGGLFTKDQFDITLAQDTVTCPNQVTVPVRRSRDGTGTAAFGAACAGCPRRDRCTTAAEGRTVTISAYEAELNRARNRQTDPAWKADYTATRPKVERKIGHLMRRSHGGRRARVRGLVTVTADFALLAAATNLARLGRLTAAFTTTATPAVTPA
jgi:Transposase DDE domain